MVLYASRSHFILLLFRINERNSCIKNYINAMSSKSRMYMIYKHTSRIAMKSITSINHVICTSFFSFELNSHTFLHQLILLLRHLCK